MKKIYILIPLIVLAIGIPAFNTLSTATTRAKFLKIRESRPAMTVDQVMALVGNPAHIEHSETTGITGDVYQYSISQGEMKIVFINGTVFNVEFVPGAKS